MPFPETRVVNTVIATIAPGWSLDYDTRGPRTKVVLRYGDGTLPVRLRSSDRLWLSRPRNFRHWGGTTEQALCQLILWHRDLPRRPLAWWKHCCSEHVGLGSAETFRLLSDDGPGGYADPERVCCVLCGAVEPSDWWALDRMIGPCCFAGKCRKVTGG